MQITVNIAFQSHSCGVFLNLDLVSNPIIFEMLLD